MLSIKQINSSAIILLLAVIVFANCKQLSPSTNDIIQVDVTKTNYPKKKELVLQDFMDVEYIVLETNDEFINQGFVRAIGEEHIIVTNRINDGDIFIYDRSGKALRKINRRGQGPEEYVRIQDIVLDEESDEIFINSPGQRSILVYDLYGNFKRSLKHHINEEAGSLFFTNIFNYCRDYLICYDQFNRETSFVLISKQDGSITQKINLPFDKKIDAAQYAKTGGGMAGFYYRMIIPFKDEWLLVELSSDTIYTLLPDYSLRPFLARTPPVQNMDPEIFLLLTLLSDRYIFMETKRNEYDFEKRRGFPVTSFLMYDRQERAVLSYNVFNGDYTSKKEIFMNWLRPLNHEIESWQPLEAFELVEDYNNGILQGKLEEIASTLDPEDNPVIMLIKHKQ